MRSIFSYKNFLKKATKFEERYRWVEAVSVYRTAYSYALKANNLKDLIKISEKMGVALVKAAMQSQNPKQFLERLQLAKTSFEKAASLCVEENGSNKAFFKAMVTYVESKMTSEGARKKKKLYESYNLMFKFLNFLLKRAQLKLGGVHNQFLVIALDLLYLEANWKKRRQIIEQAISVSDKCFSTSSKINDLKVFAEALALKCLLYDLCYGIYDLREKEINYMRKCLDHAHQSLEVAKKTKDSYVRSLACYALSWVLYGFKGNLEASLKLSQDALEESLKTKDHSLIGKALFSLAEITYWKTLTEEDPEKIREHSSQVIKYSEEAASHGLIVFEDYIVTNALYRNAEVRYYLASNLEIYRWRKRKLLKTAAEKALEGLKKAEKIGMPSTMQLLSHALSKAQQLLSKVEKNIGKKKELLEKASEYRQNSIKMVEASFPFMYWEQGVNWNYQSQITAELAYLEKVWNAKEKLLQKALSQMEKCLLLCKKSAEFYKQERLFAALARYYDNFALLSFQLYNTRREKTIADKAIKACTDSIAIYKRLDKPARVAEALWKIGRIKDYMGQYIEAAEAYETASKEYENAIQKIPALKKFYETYRDYMKAWSEIEKAKNEHYLRNYSSAATHYEKAARIHDSLKPFCHLALNYLAWNYLEKAEDLSKKEEARKSAKYFQKAIKTFQESSDRLRRALKKLGSPQDKDLATQLIRASDLRQEYCTGRIYVEEAKLDYMQGKYLQSSRKYALAAQSFEKVLKNLETEHNRKEILPIMQLCKAWEKMMLAHWKLSKELFNEASKLFERVLEYSTDEKLTLFALGNSVLCKALEAMMSFEATRDRESYQLAKRMLESCQTYFLKAKIKEASMWVQATESLLDAYFYMTAGEIATDLKEKTRMFKLAEASFSHSIKLYENAGYTGKKKELETILKALIEKRKLAFSMVKVLETPSKSSSTALLVVPTPSYENAVGTEEFETANIKININAPKEVNLEEHVEILIDLVNVGKNLGLLVRISSIIPSGFDIVRIPQEYVLEGTSLNARGKKLQPLATESIKIILKPLKTGIFTLSPKVTYIDEQGNFKYSTPEPVVLKVEERKKFLFEKKEAKLIFEYLTKAFITDYMHRKFSMENSGWRSRVKISNKTQVSWSSLYGDHGRIGYGISELMRRGLAEIRFFKGEKGRGGKVLKARVAYNRDIVKRYIDNYIMTKK